MTDISEIARNHPHRRIAAVHTEIRRAETTRQLIAENRAAREARRPWWERHRTLIEAVAIGLFLTALIIGMLIFNAWRMT